MNEMELISYFSQQAQSGADSSLNDAREWEKIFSYIKQKRRDKKFITSRK
jgi:hypothetical protein